MGLLLNKVIECLLFILFEDMGSDLWELFYVLLREYFRWIN